MSLVFFGFLMLGWETAKVERRDFPGPVLGWSNTRSDKLIVVVLFGVVSVSVLCSGFGIFGKTHSY